MTSGPRTRTATPLWWCWKTDTNSARISSTSFPFQTYAMSCFLWDRKRRQCMAFEQFLQQEAGITSVLYHFFFLTIFFYKNRLNEKLKFYDTFFPFRLMYQMILRSLQSTNTVARETSSIKRGLKSVKQALSRKKASPQTVRPSPDKVTIEVKDFEVGVFERLMRYIHCGVVAVDPRTVAGQAF